MDFVDASDAVERESGCLLLLCAVVEVVHHPQDRVEEVLELEIFLESVGQL